KVAITSLNHRFGELRRRVETLTAGSANMRLAMITPMIAPAAWAATYAPSSTRRSPPKNASAQLTAGFRCAPEADPTARIMATKAEPSVQHFRAVRDRCRQG